MRNKQCCIAISVLSLSLSCISDNAGGSPLLKPPLRPTTPARSTMRGLPAHEPFASLGKARLGVVSEKSLALREGVTRVNPRRIDAG
jgi:hypothetical protein